MDDLKAIKEELICAICLDEFNEPKTLPVCGHSFCLNCIRELLKYGKINCPVCRKDSIVPGGNPSNLANNFLANNLLELIRKSEKDPKRSSLNLLSSSSGKRNSEPASRLPQARGLYNFVPLQPGDLEFKTGDIITILDSNGGWWKGECRGQTGVFPSNYVEIIQNSSRRNTLDMQPSLNFNPNPPPPPDFGSEADINIDSGFRRGHSQTLPASSSPVIMPIPTRIISPPARPSQSQPQRISSRIPPPQNSISRPLHDNHVLRSQPANNAISSRLPPQQHILPLIRLNSQNAQRNILSNPLQVQNRAPSRTHNRQSVVVPAPPITRYCEALFDFRAEINGDLSFSKGDKITLLDSSQSWWKGELNGEQGIFPSNYVRLL